MAIGVPGGSPSTHPPQNGLPATGNTSPSVGAWIANELTIASAALDELD